MAVSKGSKVKVKVTLDQGAINSFLIKTTDLSARTAATAVRDRARLLAPKNTGALRSSITYRKESQSNTQTTYLVGSSKKYAVYQEEGIGPVQAPPGGVLRFRPKGMTAFIFRPRTKGFPGTHFMRKAYRALSLSDFVKP